MTDTISELVQSRHFHFMKHYYDNVMRNGDLGFDSTNVLVDCAFLNSQGFLGGPMGSKTVTKETILVITQHIDICWVMNLDLIGYRLDGSSKNLRDVAEMCKNGQPPTRYDVRIIDGPTSLFDWSEYFEN